MADSKETANPPYTPVADRSEAERFEDLARKLVRVPKREIDEERAKQNGEKPRP